MLKLKKGHKKKNKRKAAEEGLTKEEQEELRIYRLEKEREQKEKEREEGGGEKETKKNTKQSEEWATFNALTSGVDQIIGESSKNLEDIKETSYFQRTKKPEETKTEVKVESEQPPKRWVNVENELEVEEEEEKVQKPSQEEEEQKQEETEEEHIDPEHVEDVIAEVERYERQQYFEEDIFNTEYVDAVTSGELKLPYIPDSPTDDGGDDPFDTSVVDRILESEDPKKKKQRLIKLGSAVEVLSGQIVEKSKENSEEKTTEKVELKKKPKRVRKKYASVDLLGGSGEVKNVGEEKNKLEKEAANVVNVLLDDTLDDADTFELNLTVTPDFAKQFPKSETEEQKAAEEENKEDEEVVDCTNEYKGQELKSLVEEFDCIKESSNRKDFDEKEKLEEGKQTEEEDCDFDELATESLAKAKDRQEAIGDDDPFDTTAAKKVLEKETEVVDLEEFAKFETSFNKENKVKPERPPPPVKALPAADFITCDICESVPHKPLDVTENVVCKEEESGDKKKGSEEERDPFDTSFADYIGPSEIKLIESELLDANVVADDDFDPRAEEEPLEVDPFDTSIADYAVVKRQLIEEGDIINIDKEPVELLTSTPLCDDDQTAVLAASTSFCQEEEIDPFDTSAAEIYGSIELEVLEKELAKVDELPKLPQVKLDLSATSQPPPRPPSPIIKNNFKVTFDDDSVDGKQELVDTKQEDDEEHKELLASSPVPLDQPVLSPTAQEGGLISDPFDTSIADSLVVSSVELKIIEKELLEDCQQQSTNFKRSVSDNDFNPRSDEEQLEQQLSHNLERTESPDPFDTSVVEKLGIVLNSISSEISTDPFELTTPSDPNPIIVPNQPTSVRRNFAETFDDDEDEIDPFDTSVAEIFTKTELKSIEAELVGEVRCALPQRPPNPKIKKRSSEDISSVSSLNLETTTQRTRLPSADELLATTPTNSLAPTIAPAEEKPRVLTPVTLDPFDTSIADAFSHTELKVIETEILGEPCCGNDEDFNPRASESGELNKTTNTCHIVNKHTDNLHHTALAQTIPVDDKLSEEEIDPFDTSFVNNIV